MSMQTAIISVVEGPNKGLQTTIRFGQSIQIGKSTWADMQCSGDDQLEDIHFAITSANTGWNITVMDESKPVEVDGSLTSQSSIQHNSKINAGKSVFVILDANRPWKSSNLPDGKQSGEQQEEIDPVADALPAVELLTELQIENPLPDAIESEDSAILEAFKGEERWLDAVRMIAARLGAKAAVEWELAACQSLELSESFDEEISSLVQSWIEETTEEKRRKAEQYAEGSGLESISGWLGQTIFWSDGSLSAPDLPEVPVPKWLFTEAVKSVMLMASLEKDPGESSEVWEQILGMGIDQMES